MKGKKEFTKQEIETLRSLINQRVRAERSKQKGIRDKMRRIGFYSTDFGINDTQISDLDNLIRSGLIRVIGETEKNIPLPPRMSPKRTDMFAGKEQPAVTSRASDVTAAFSRFDPKTDDAHKIPDMPGNYIVCLREGAVLPDTGIPCEMRTYENLRVIYTGIAGSSLRTRDYAQHFTGNNAGRSTLRKSLGSLFGYRKIPRDKNPESNKTKFTPEDEEKLSAWMQDNLILFFQENPNPDAAEDQLIAAYNPPLNLAKNNNPTNRDFRWKLSELRR